MIRIRPKPNDHQDKQHLDRWTAKHEDCDRPYSPLRKTHVSHHYPTQLKTKSLKNSALMFTNRTVKIQRGVSTRHSQWWERSYRVQSSQHVDSNR